MSEHLTPPPAGTSRFRSAPAAIAAMRIQLEHLERLVGTEVRSVEHAEQRLRPAWQRATAGEHRLPVALVVTTAIVLELVLPARLAFRPSWLLPALQLALLVGLFAANPRRIGQSSRRLRLASLTLIAIMSLANAWSAAELVRGLVAGTEGSDAASLLGNGAAIYVTNIIVFGLWYWEFDRGGPGARAAGTSAHPDFLFPQMVSPELAPAEWRPTFVDYAYVSFTNATAFSPTDTMPLSRGAKGIMTVQSSVSLITVALVVARAVNIFR